MALGLRQAAGSLLVVGLGGTELTGLERAWLKLVRPAGIILFKRNIVDAGQTRRLLGEAAAFCTSHCLRCVDVEGGTVDRLRDAVAPMPSAQAVARAANLMGDGKKDIWGSRFPRSQKRDLGHPARAANLMGDGKRDIWGSRFPRSQKRGLGHPASVEGIDEDRADSCNPTLGAKTRTRRGWGTQDSWAYEHGELVALGVRAFGFNTTLAPVLDLALPESVEVMGTRAAAATAAGVVEYARGFLAGLAAEGVVGCGKHYPGLGGGGRDSHLETPAIRRGWREIWEQDLAPYRELGDELPVVMVNHAAYPETGGKDRPASVSPFWITTVLRKRLGYGGIAFSDDLEMGGILKFMPIEEAAVAAVRAGMDLLEICHSPELILRAYEALIAEGERSGTFRELLMARARRTGRLRAKLFAGGVAKALTVRQFEALRGRILRFGEAVKNAELTGEVHPA